MLFFAAFSCNYPGWVWYHSVCHRVHYITIKSPQTFPLNSFHGIADTLAMLPLNWCTSFKLISVNQCFHPHQCKNIQKNKTRWHELQLLWNTFHCDLSPTIRCYLCFLSLFFNEWICLLIHVVFLSVIMVKQKGPHPGDIHSFTFPSLFRGPSEEWMSVMVCGSRAQMCCVQ